VKAMDGTEWPMWPCMAIIIMRVMMMMVWVGLGSVPRVRVG